MVKKMFCADCQEEIDHSFSSNVADITATCLVCGRVWGFPPKLSATELTKAIKNHKEVNIK
jgi:RNase P subunit RPR2